MYELLARMDMHRSGRYASQVTEPPPSQPDKAPSEKDKKNDKQQQIHARVWRAVE